MKVLILSVMMLGIYAFVGYLGLQVLDAPYVFYSYNSKKCVRIETIDERILPCSEEKNFRFKNFKWIE